MYNKPVCIMFHYYSFELEEYFLHSLSFQRPLSILVTAD